MEWRERGWFLAMDRDIACGIAGSFLDENDPTRAYLISMWTAPTHRQRGIGRLLVKEVLNWARSRNARILQLMVRAITNPRFVSTNDLGSLEPGELSLIRM